MKSSNDFTLTRRIPRDALGSVLITLEMTRGADAGVVTSLNIVDRGMLVRAQRSPFLGRRIHSGYRESESS